MAYGMCITTAMNVMMRMCVSEGNSWGWSIVGCKHVTMDTCYDEANTYGIDVSNNTNGFVISNCFHYGVAIAILLQSCHNGVVRNNIIQDSSQAFYLDGTCINLDIRNNYTNFLVTAGAGSVMAMTALKPRGCYIEFPTWGTEVQRMVAVDQTRFRRASPYGGSYQRKVLPVKVAAGAPDDATYGSWTGSIVFNKGDNKLYVRLAGSFGSPSAWLGAGLS